MSTLNADQGNELHSETHTDNGLLLLTLNKAKVLIPCLVLVLVGLFPL